MNKEVQYHHDSHIVHTGYGKIPVLLIMIYVFLPIWSIWYFSTYYNASPMKLENGNMQMNVPAPQMGKEIAGQQGCFACHGPEGKGGVQNPGHKDGYVPAWDGDDLADNNLFYPILLRQEIEKAVIPSMYQDPADIGTQEFAPFKMQPWIGRLTTQQINDIMAYIYSINPKLQDNMREILKGQYDVNAFVEASGDINPAYVGLSYGEVRISDGTPLGTPAVAQFPPGQGYPEKYDQYYEENKDANPPQFVKDVEHFANLIQLKE